MRFNLACTKISTLSKTVPAVPKMFFSFNELLVSVVTFCWEKNKHKRDYFCFQTKTGHCACHFKGLLRKFDSFSTPKIPQFCGYAETAAFPASAEGLINLLFDSMICHDVAVVNFLFCFKHTTFAFP